MVLVLIWANEQEDTTWQETMPQEHTSQYICAEQPAAERTIEHLFNERIAMPISAAGEIPGYQPHHSKPKCLLTADRMNRFIHSQLTHNSFEHYKLPNVHHVIDYYIYTLEHILI